MKTWEKFLFYGMLWSIHARVCEPGIESALSLVFALVCGFGVLTTVFKGDA